MTLMTTIQLGNVTWNDAKIDIPTLTAGMLLTIMWAKGRAGVQTPRCWPLFLF